MHPSHQRHLGYEPLSTAYDAAQPADAHAPVIYDYKQHRLPSKSATMSSSSSLKYREYHKYSAHYTVFPVLYYNGRVMECFPQGELHRDSVQGAHDEC